MIAIAKANTPDHPPRPEAPKLGFLWGVSTSSFQVNARPLLPRQSLPKATMFGLQSAQHASGAQSR
jgi:hypothetical protein